MTTRREFFKSAAITAAGLATIPQHDSFALGRKSRLPKYMQFAAGAPEAIKDSWTIAVLPDTQYYTQKFHKHFETQTKWLAQNAKKYNIKFVMHLGDVTNNNSPAEWSLARKAFKILDQANLPYAICLGNHDMSPGGICIDRTSLFWRYFTMDHWKKMETFAGVYPAEPKLADNCYHKFTVGKTKMLILCIEFGPREKVLKWASKIVKAHADHKVIVLTHAYLHRDSKRQTTRNRHHQHCPHHYKLSSFHEGVNDGEEVWQKFVSRHKNIQQVICGHIYPFGNLSSKARGGNSVHQMLVDYQGWHNGGDGWLRLLQFNNDHTKINVQDFSPSTNQVNNSAEAKFEISLA